MKRNFGQIKEYIAIIDKTRRLFYTVTMKKIKRALNIRLAISVFFTLLYPAGGILLGIGLKLGYPAMWGTGIGCLAAAFYGCPISWTVGYARIRSLYRLVDAIVNEKLYTVTALSSYLGIKERKVHSELTKCINRYYLQGYNRVGDRIYPNPATQRYAEAAAAKCLNCGASLNYNTLKKGWCPNCGTPVPNDYGIKE